MFDITYTDRFAKNYRKLQTMERKQAKAKIEILKNNPNHPSLRTKKVMGIDGLFEASVNMSIRILWYYEKSAIIILLDIGRHEMLNNLSS